MPQPGKRPAAASLYRFLKECCGKVYADSLLDNLHEPKFVVEMVILWIKASKKSKKDILDLIQNGMPQEQVDTIFKIAMEEEKNRIPTSEELKAQFKL